MEVEITAYQDSSSADLSMIFKEKRYKAKKAIENKTRNTKHAMSNYKTITFYCHGAMS